MHKAVAAAVAAARAERFGFASRPGGHYPDPNPNPSPNPSPTPNPYPGTLERKEGANFVTRLAPSLPLPFSLLPFFPYSQFIPSFNFFCRRQRSIFFYLRFVCENFYRCSERPRAARGEIRGGGVTRDSRAVSVLGGGGFRV